MSDNDTDIEIWAMRLKYNKAQSRDILRVNMLNVLRHKGLGEDEIRRQLKIHDLL